MTPWKDGDRVRLKKNAEIKGTVERTQTIYPKSPHRFPLVTVRLDEPLPCSCGASHGTKMSASPESWESTGE